MNNNKNKLILIIGIAIVISVATILISMALHKKNNDDNIEDITASSAFFIENENNLYALFNENGKKITDFIFSDVEEFYNNVAEVENTDGEKAIINTDGKYVVNFGEYDSIYQWGAIFKVCTEDGEWKVLNSKGQSILNGNYDIETYNYRYYAYAVSNDDEINVVDFNGNILDTYTKSSEDDNLYDLQSDGDNVIIIYQDKAYLYSIDASKKILEIEKNGDESINKKNAYFEASEEYNVLVVYPFSDKYYVYKDNKLKFTLSDDECKGYFEFYKEGLAYRQGGAGATDYILADYNGNVIAKGVVEITNTDNYITHEHPNTATFYQNNKETKKLEMYSSQISTIGGGYHNDNILVRDNSTYTYYNLNGEKINETPYYKATFFSNQGYAAVWTDKNKTFLIDKNNNKVSEIYDSIESFETNTSGTYQDNLWIANKDGEKYLLSNEGKVILSGFNNVDDVYEVDDKIIIEYNDSTKIYSMNLNKVVLDLNVKSSNLKVDENYAYVEEDESVSYYSYITGSKFYSKNK